MSKAFTEKMEEYYKLKMEYNAEYDNLTGAIKNNTQLNAQEKREKWLSIHPKCIGCKRPVGTIFATQVAEDTKERILTAGCGDKTDPCALQIKLAMGETRQLPDFIEEEEAELKRVRTMVIELKNKLMVGAVDNKDVLGVFDELKDDINTSNKMLEYYLTLYSKFGDNAEKLQRIESDKFMIKDEMRRAMAAFRATGNTKFAQDAVEIYINQMRPLIKTDLNDKYAECRISTTTVRGSGGGGDKNNDDDDSDDEGGDNNGTSGAGGGQNIVYSLIQRKVTPKMLEYTLIEPRVIAFNLGAPVAAAAVAAPKKRLIKKK